jgi:hypothetical protein
MVLFKACPTCHGDLHLERDFDTRVPPDLICLQCGRYLRPDELQSMLSRRGPVVAVRRSCGTRGEALQRHKLR